MKGSGLPLRHLSIRVPWQDTGWTGRVCKDPVGNSACLRLENIRASRDDAVEVQLAGRSLLELSQTQLPPCVAERATFMADFPVSREVEHPYTRSSKSYDHYLPTTLSLPPYSAGCVPFRWVLRDDARETAEMHGLDFRDEGEDEATKRTGFKSAWLQDVSNQRSTLDGFFSAIKPDRSLAFFYAKELPFVDDPRRVLIGVGRVTAIGSALEYGYSSEGPSRSLIWERAVEHSIRPAMNDGFLLPYHEAVARSADDPTIDPAELVAFTPDEAFEQFSFGSEHVSDDQAIASILNLIRGLDRAERVLGTSYATQRAWCSDRLGELWKLRGPYPGLGAALGAFGIPLSTLFAGEVSARVPEGQDPWPLVDQAIANPKVLGERWVGRVGPTSAKKFTALAPNRRALLELIARFDLTPSQAKRLYSPESRAKAGISMSDEDILANPYQLYLADRLNDEPISVQTIDRGAFPPPVIAAGFPLPEPSLMREDVDGRRVSAHVVHVLEQLAVSGDTVATISSVTQGIDEMNLDPSYSADSDLFAVLDEDFSGLIRRVPLGDDNTGLQLERLAEVGEGIRKAVTRRAQATNRHPVKTNWLARLSSDEFLGPANPNDQDEAQAREEKAAALTELAQARVSVLVGPAGTGKTTLLAALCSEPSIRSSGVLLLAPTGKARVQLEKGFSQSSFSPRARTIAEFLYSSGRYNPETQRYQRSDTAPAADFGTLIIDEASMLTEDQLDAVLDGTTNVSRLILVGDPQQLPPIGPGRPFVDIVDYLAGDSRLKSPRVGSSYAELTVRRRQSGEDRHDLTLASWFGSDSPSSDAEEVWSQMLRGDASSTVRFEQWSEPHEVFELLLSVLADELDEVGDPDDVIGFAQSLGATESGGSVYFNRSKKGVAGAGPYSENWQVLSPVRGGAHGITELNRSIQRRLRSETIASARKIRRTAGPPLPMGPEEIVYGDKVMSVANGRRTDVWPKNEGDSWPGEPLSYVANGEIGMVIGQLKSRKDRWKGLPKNLNVEFSTQQGFSYGYRKKDFSNEGGSKLELAYAITIHKSQGSEFGLTALVLPNPCRLLSRELLYTALTRHREKMIVLHQGSLAEMLAYSSSEYSDTARRLTNLFIAPSPVEFRGKFLDDRRIHRTVQGELVRSKSEVIIANALHAAGVRYQYEEPFVGSDRSQRLPDFTIDDPETGQRFVWEHLGMLNDRKYREAWKRKIAWYEANGVLPAESGGGAKGTLVTTEDDVRGGIDSAHIAALISGLFT